MVLKHSKDSDVLEFLCFSLIVGVEDNCFDYGPAYNEDGCAATCIAEGFSGYAFCGASDDDCMCTDSDEPWDCLQFC